MTGLLSTVVVGPPPESGACADLRPSSEILEGVAPDLDPGKARQTGTPRLPRNGLQP